MSNLLDKASIILTPTAYDDGKVLAAKPSEAPYGDFDFTRNSSATRVNAQGLVEDVQIISSDLVQNGDFSQIGSQEVTNGNFSQIGSEEVTNGNFSQEGAEQADDSVISNAGGSVMTKVSALNYNATSDGTGGSTIRPRLLFNNTPLGKNYKLIIKPTNQSGTINFKLYNGGSYVIDNNDLSSDINFYFSVEGGASVLIAFDGTEVFNVDFEISLKEVGQDWTLGTGWSIGDDKAISDGSASNLDQSGTFLSGKTYKVVYDVLDYVSGDIRFRFTGTTNENGTLRNANGTYTEYIKLANNQELLRFPSWQVLFYSPF